ncbi:Hsp20/alpha crystallin family protein [Actinomycetospora sp. OC33-EN08]|uniref:Hsp20/alpha crystallin family protein n=1 Tax=Actinomycetospora aurantiaca TaxID=3129233 RepID=A0ABU8MWV3_9PSEU
MLLNYDPVDAFRSLDRLTGWRGQPGTGMPMDLHRAGDHVVATFDVPGVDPGSIDITVEGNSVTVRAERTAPADSGEWLVAERPRGRYSRSLTLGRDLDVDRLHASYVDGVLSLTIPVAERAKPRQVSVEHAGAPRSIDADRTDRSDHTEPADPAEPAH